MEICCNRMNVFSKVFRCGGNKFHFTKQVVGQGKAAQILAKPLSYKSSGILLFQIWLNLGLRLGKTEAESSNDLLAAYFSRHKISNMIKQAFALE